MSINSGIAARLINQIPVSNVVRAAFGPEAFNGAPAYFTISTDGYFSTIKGVLTVDNTIQQCDGGFIIITSGESEGIIPRDSQISVSIPDIASITTFASNRTTF